MARARPPADVESAGREGPSRCRRRARNRIGCRERHRRWYATSRRRRVACRGAVRRRTVGRTTGSEPRPRRCALDQHAVSAAPVQGMAPTDDPPAARQFCCSCNALDTGGVNPNPERARRRYTSPLREEAARRTRETIRDAAARLFVRDGYVSTTVKNIADEAGVAVRTVFTAFPGGKAEIFREALDHAVAGDGYPRATAAAEPEPSHAGGAVSHVDLVVEQVVRYGTAMLERAGGLLMTSVESSGADPDMRRFAADDAKATAENARTLAEGLEHAGW